MAIDPEYPIDVGGNLRAELAKGTSKLTELVVTLGLACAVLIAVSGTFAGMMSMTRRQAGDARRNADHLNDLIQNMLDPLQQHELNRFQDILDATRSGSISDAIFRKDAASGETMGSSSGSPRVMSLTTSVRQQLTTSS